MEAQIKNCQNCKKDFVIEPDDFAFYEKMKVPAPTWCPACRTQRRILFRNERFLYKNKSDFSGKEIFSMRPQEIDLKVYENDIWYSDKWDAQSYGKDYDFSKPFFEQLLDLYKKVPLFALSTIQGTNSDYCNNFGGLKNCYLVFSSNYSEDCMYSTGINYSKNCIDNIKSFKSENCYGNFFVNSSFNIFFSVQCSDSMNLWFCKDCVGCNDCIGCVGLRSKNYHIFNKAYSKEEYQAELKKFGFGSYNSVKDFSKRAHAFWFTFPVKYMSGLKNFNVSGEYIKNSKDVRNSYQVSEGENLKYCSEINIGPAKDCYDYNVWGAGAELVYECMACGMGASKTKFCAECWPEVTNTEYSIFCQSSSNLFGCVSLRKKEYCILNKQYSKEEYEETVAKIKNQMNEMPYKDKRGIEYKYGEFFPAVFSSAFYNHSLAYEHFPLSREEAESRGYYWKENAKRDYKITKKSDELPDNIKDAPDSIVNEVISCEDWEEDSAKASQYNCTEGFRILPAELEFYRRYDLPLPRKCFNCRYNERLQWRNPMKLYQRKCQCAGEKSENGTYQNTAAHQHGTGYCQNEFKTSYAPDRPEIVYCEQCYQQEVV